MEGGRRGDDEASVPTDVSVLASEVDVSVLVVPVVVGDALMKGKE